jgi:hypothetical protein
MKFPRHFIALLLAVAAMHSSALACAVCGGDPNPNVIAASNGVIWMLLGLVGFIFTSSGLTVLYLWWRSK